MIFCFARIALKQENFDEALRWFEKVTNISERIGDQEGLGESLLFSAMMAEKLKEYDQAKTMNRRLLKLAIDLKNDRLIGLSLNSLSRLAAGRSDYVETGRMLIDSIQAYFQAGEDELAQETKKYFAQILEGLPKDEHEALIQMWESSDLGPLPDQKEESPLPKRRPVFYEKT